MALALMPLAVAAIISNQQSIESAEKEKAQLVAASTRLNAAQLASDIDAIATAQALTANVIASQPGPDHICSRMQILFQSMAGSDGIVSVIFDRDGRIKCGLADGAALAAKVRARGLETGRVIVVPDLNGVLVRVQSHDRSQTAVALYRKEALRRLTNANGRDPLQSVVLTQGERRLWLTDFHAGGVDDHRVAARSSVGSHGFHIATTVTNNSKSTRTLSLMMPLVLWMAAAFLGWLVVRWTLIEPLIALRREVAAYVPGKIMHPPQTAKLASSEIVELGEAFHAMSKDVAEHEGEMRQALNRQMQLTREVHHRVKNNLQIISSLISLHWRAAADADTAGCYLSIQRRVDALAVVQRNHYAELDQDRGVRARAMISEIAAALRTSAQIQGDSSLDIAIDCDDVYLHLDIAAPIAFMTAELADLVIALESAGRLSIHLKRLQTDADRAQFSVASSAFQASGSISSKVTLYERVLNGLARQLRSPLTHDVEQGKYQIVIPVRA